MDADDNIRKIEFTNFELKMDADVRVILNTFFYFKIKVSLELEVTISRPVKDIVKMLKHPSGY